MVRLFPESISLFRLSIKSIGNNEFWEGVVGMFKFIPVIFFKFRFQKFKNKANESFLQMSKISLHIRELSVKTNFKVLKFYLLPEKIGKKIIILQKYVTCLNKKTMELTVKKSIQSCLFNSNSKLSRLKFELLFLFFLGIT